MLKSDREKLSKLFKEKGKQRASLDTKDKKFVSNYTELFIQNNPECMSEYDLILQLYSLELKLIYLSIILGNEWNLDSSRMYNYIKEAQRLMNEFGMKGYSLIAGMLSSDGYDGKSGY